MSKISLPDEDTIAAIATPPGEGGIAVTRISGADASYILDRVFKRFFEGKSVSDMETHRLYRGQIIEPGSGDIVDDVLCTVMKAPHSYTGEEMAEIHSHGGYLVPKKILSLLIKNGARPAQPGEFTLRAFLNGKMDLAQAEAVTDVVNAKTYESLKQAERQLEGALSERIVNLKENLLDILAEIEAQVDFPEECIDAVLREQMVERTELIVKNLNALLSTYEQGRILKQGVYTAIVGKPNVGKSSLLNQLIMRERAIVSPHPGTTRDFIEETIDVRGIPLRLVDTAGMRSSSDEIERVGVELAEKKIEEAEIIIVVIDGSENLDEDDLNVLGKIDGRRSVLAVNKSDLGTRISKPQLRQFLPENGIAVTSAKYGSGIEELKDKIYNLLLGSKRGAEGSEVVITELRHKAALERSKSALFSFMEALEIEESPEYLAVDLRYALDSLGEITGETTTEDILGRIFSKFCVGK